MGWPEIRAVAVSVRGFSVFRNSAIEAAEKRPNSVILSSSEGSALEFSSKYRSFLRSAQDRLLPPQDDSAYELYRKRYNRGAAFPLATKTDQPSARNNLNGSMPMEENLLPLFPLEIVLLPEEPLPLHIFEDRYKLMIGECLEAKTSGQGQQEFGILLLKGQAVSTVGCTARIVNVTRQYEDGRLDILTIGRRRFEILLANEEKPYLQGTVEYFDDEGPDAPGNETAELAIARFREVMRRLRHAAEMPIHLPRPYRYLSFRIAAALPFDTQFKQRLLLLKNEPERLALVQRAMEMLMNQLDHVQESQKRAGGNGHARHG